MSNMSPKPPLSRHEKHQERTERAQGRQNPSAHPNEEAGYRGTLSETPSPQRHPEHTVIPILLDDSLLRKPTPCSAWL